MNRIRTTALALLLAPVVWASSPSFSGKVVGVSKGDTISVLHNGKEERVRLYGIVCPHISQPFGRKAMEYTASILMGKEVKVEGVGTDLDGTTVAYVYFGSGLLKPQVLLNGELITAGLAWWDRKNVPNDAGLEYLEESAQEARVGLWVDQHPIPPWDWRHRHRK